MTERAIEAAIAITTRWEAERVRTPLDRVVSAEFRSRRYLNSGERRQLSATVYGSVRFLRRQTWLLEQLGLPPTPENLIRLWPHTSEQNESVQNESVQNESVQNESVQNESVQNEQVNREAERASSLPLLCAPEAIESALSALPGSDRPREALCITHSFPDDMADALLALIPDEALEAARALNEQAPVTLRVNPLRVSHAHLLRALPEATPTLYSPWGLELPRRVNINDLPGYRTGWFEVQEEASQLAALLVDPQPGETVVEVGAGAGGKTLALAALMDNRGALLALDTDGARLEELRRRADRAGVTCAETVQVSADDSGWWQPSTSARRTINRVWSRAACVLVDAPCTGSGVLRRSPDAKWRTMDRAGLQQLQRTLLAQAAMFVAPRGRLIYVTCAFERDQNEEIIEAFLETEMGAQFKVESAAQRLIAARKRAAELALLPPSLRSSRSGRASNTPKKDQIEDQVEDQVTPVQTGNLDALTEGLYMRTWPHRHGLDAFFAACLTKQP